MKPTPQIIIRNFDKSERTLCQESGSLADINMSSIATKLIQNTGRFCERFASDLIISWNIVREHLEPRPIDEPYRTVEIFGIRRSGVDHNNFFMSHLRNEGRERFFCCERVYQKVLALDIQITPADYPGDRPRVVCTLKDLTDELWEIKPGDLEENAA